MTPSAQTDQHNDHKYVPHDVQAIKGKEAKEMTTYQTDRLFTKEQVVEIAKHVAKKATDQHEQTVQELRVEIVTTCPMWSVKYMDKMMKKLVDQARHEGMMAERERIKKLAVRTDQPLNPKYVFYTILESDLEGNT